MNEESAPKGAPKVIAATPRMISPSADKPRSTWPVRWKKVVDRRLAQRELDELLAEDPYPDVVAVYGLRAEPSPW
jgi:hypothetical protein